jgi:hypothetical protein
MIRGPQDWEEARRNMLSFAEELTHLGLRGTFFLCPEALRHLGKDARDLQDAGMELGVLSHPQLSSYQSYLGSYGYDRQREIIHMHKEVWQDRLGAPARAFRAGFFSASDYTFQILCLEGFSETSCSLPGRIDPEQCSMWLKAWPFPHHTDPLDRKLKGTMELYEVPVTSDSEAKEHVAAETFTPPHLRIEEPGINDYAADLLRRQLARMDEEDVPVKVVNLVTQNCAGWGAPEDPLTERLQNLKGLLENISRERETVLEAASLARLHELADEAWHRRA